MTKCPRNQKDTHTDTKQLERDAELSHKLTIRKKKMMDETDTKHQRNKTTKMIQGHKISTNRCKRAPSKLCHNIYYAKS